MSNKDFPVIFLRSVNLLIGARYSNSFLVPCMGLLLPKTFVSVAYDEVNPLEETNIFS